MSHSIAIVGAGVLGRLLTLAFDRKGWNVTLYDRGDRSGSGSCSWSAAGMIAPYISMKESEQTATVLGEYAIEQWPTWLETLSSPVYHGENGCLAVAHPRDALELERLYQHITDLTQHDDLMTECTAPDIVELEPELAGRFHRGLFFPFEQHIDNRQLLRVLGETIEAAAINWFDHTDVSHLEAHQVTSIRGVEKYDWVIDVRGLGAKSDVPGLRGVRGELLHVSAPDVHLTRPVRLMHPRHMIYIVPRADRHYVIGATSEDVESLEPVSVRSTMELLSAAVTVHPGFGEARLLETVVNLRPTLPDQRPRITPQQGLMSINGLYRFGILVSPALVDIAVTFIDTGEVHPMAEGVMEEWSL